MSGLGRSDLEITRVRVYVVAPDVTPPYRFTGFDEPRTMQFGYYWQIAYPLFFFIITIFAFFFVGDGLRDALDPKDR